MDREFLVFVVIYLLEIGWKFVKPDRVLFVIMHGQSSWCSLQLPQGAEIAIG
jgi:hypothetical protein